MAALTSEQLETLPTVKKKYYNDIFADLFDPDKMEECQAQIQAPQLQMVDAEGGFHKITPPPKKEKRGPVIYTGNDEQAEQEPILYTGNDEPVKKFQYIQDINYIIEKKIKKENNPIYNNIEEIVWKLAKK